MLAKRKGLRVSRSNQDYDLFNFVYYGYTPTMNIKFEVVENSPVSKNDILAIISNHGLQQKLYFNYSGTVERISIPKFQGQQKMLNACICEMRGCDHSPRLNVVESALDYCAGCQEVLWYYYSRQLITFSLSDLQQRMQITDKQFPFQWTIIKNQHFTKNTVLGKTPSSQFKLQFSGKVVFTSEITKLNQVQQVNSLDKNDNVILKVRKVICRHQKIIDLICQFCLETIQEYPKIYLFRNNNIQTAKQGRALHEEEQQYIQNLFSRKKAVLILDLDNTILHSIEKSQLNQNELQELKEYYIIPRQPTPFQNQMIVKMRNHFKKFLQIITTYFDVYIYTKGVRWYGQQICECIREEFKDILQKTNYFTPQKMITRDEDPLSYRKMAKCIIPTRLDVLLIVDDRRDVWDCHGNCIFTKEFFHFIKNNQGKMQINQNNDNYLYFSSRLLKLLSQNPTKKIEIGKVHSKYKMSLLNSFKVKFILSPQNINQQQNNIIRRAKKLGILQCKEGERPHLVIRSNKLDQKQLDTVKSMMSIKVPIVSDNWINYCYEYTYMFDYEKFILDEPMSLNLVVNFNHVIAQTIEQFNL